MKLASAIQQAGTREVDLGLMKFRIRRIVSASLVNIGRPLLLMAAKAVEEAEGAGDVEALGRELYEEIRGSGDPGATIRSIVQDPERRARFLSIVTRLLRDAEAVPKFLELLEAAAVAGVSQASQDGQSWERLELVLDARREEPGAGRLHVGSLPPSWAEQLGWSVLTFSLDGGAARERLSSFLGGDPARDPASA